MPQIPLQYSFKILNSHDGKRYIYTAWNEYYGVFLVAPSYPNARYDQMSAKEEMKKVAAEHNCFLDYPSQV